MKKIKLFLARMVALAVVSLTVASCNEELDELWLNPNNYTPQPEEVASGLFTHMQKTRFWIKDYGEWWWLLGDNGIPQHIQITGGFSPRTQAGADNLYITPNDIYFSPAYLADYPNHSAAINSTQTRQRFEQFYTDLTNYGLIRDEVNALEGEDLDNSVIYFHLATVLKDIVGMQTVDLFNAIPYTNAFRGSEGVFFAEYDDPKTIYKSAIAEMQNIVDNLEATYNAMSGPAKVIFGKQDIFFNGDVDKWKRYINGEILRACVRVSGVAIDGLDVSATIDKAIKGGLITQGTEDYLMLSRESNSVEMTWEGSGGTLPRALYERWTRLGFPDVMMVRMNRGSVKYEGGVDDPRLPVLCLGFTPTASATDVEYYGISANKVRNRAAVLGNIAGEAKRLNRYPNAVAASDTLLAINILSNQKATTLDQFVQGAAWTMYNPITYMMADDYRFNVQTRAEIDLLLAEVALKSLASTGKSAGDHIADAVRNSADYWYYLNALPHHAAPITPLASAILTPAKNDAHVTTFANTIKAEFEAASDEEDKMEILMQQKYIHLNLHGVYELFAELRRTRHPKLEPVSAPETAGANSLTNATMQIERFRYPDSERTNNAEEYQKVSKDDTWTTPVFWSAKSATPYFLPQSLKTN
jgi:hypothetical protein